MLGTHSPHHELGHYPEMNIGNLTMQTYPSLTRSLSAPGTLPCHHLQSLASRPNRLPDAEVISVESWKACQQHLKLVLGIHTKSKAAIIRGFGLSDRAASGPADGLYLPTRRVSFSTCHVIFCGSFLDSGVKKFETALPAKNQDRKRYTKVREDLTCRRRLLLAFHWRRRDGAIPSSPLQRS